MRCGGEEFLDGRRIVKANANAVKIKQYKLNSCNFIFTESLLLRIIKNQNLKFNKNRTSHIEPTKLFLIIQITPSSVTV